MNLGVKPKIINFVDDIQNRGGVFHLKDQLSLYLHFPFCKKKCVYCDFNSFSGLEELIPPYFRALKIELQKYLPESRPINSIFFGGGTPSYLPAPLLAELLSFIEEHFQVRPDAEVSLEVNPGTIGSSELALLKSAGFNRLSIGLQAWQDNLLKNIGRIHSLNDFIKIYQAGRSAGFSNQGIDIIYGLPGQKVQEWAETLKEVVSLQPEHISAYGLQLEAGARLAKDVELGLIQLPSEDEVVEMMNLTMEYLPNNGYRHYEISNYAKPEFESVHNMRYWRGNDYLGFGAGAYSTVNGERWYNIKEPGDYIDALSKGDFPIKSREKLEPKTRAAEALMLGLRLRNGLNLNEFKAEYGIDLQKTAEPYLTSLLEQKLLSVNDSCLALTNAGIRLSNSVISSLFFGI